MTPTRPAADTQPPTSDELRRRALTRSQRRGSGVAQRRLALRWLTWVAGKTGLWIGVPALALSALWWAWQTQVPRWNASPAAASGLSAAAALRSASTPGAGPRGQRGDAAQAQ